MRYVFCCPETPAHWEGLRRLNHRIFAEELGQHPIAGEGLLIDRFEARGRFVIAQTGDDVVGMLFAHAERPFSVESRLQDVAVLESLPPPVLEVRLLAIDPGHRNRMVLAGLLGVMLADALARGEGSIVISGLAGREAMYRRMGFEPLGPPVPSGRAIYVPMALRLDRLPPRILHDLRRYLRRTA